jgi:hypothetical protein
MKKRFLLLAIYTLSGALIGSIFFELCNMVILNLENRSIYSLNTDFGYRFLFSIPISFLFVIYFIKRYKDKNLTG